MQIVKHYQEIVKKLSEQKVSAHFSEALQSELDNLLKTHLVKSLNALEPKTEVKALILSMLPSLVQTEIEKQTKPLTQQIIKKMDSVEQYQGKLADLIQEVSSRL